MFEAIEVASKAKTARPKIEPARAMKRKSPQGVATSDLLLSAHVGNNEDVFPQILKLHVSAGVTIADVTYGTGIFWKKVPKEYSKGLKASDLKTGTDCRELPYKDGTIGCVVLDPPYMEGLFRRAKSHLAGSGNYSSFRATYSNGASTSGGPKYHDAVLDLYFKAGKEAHRVLSDGGVFIVKCQDEVSANVQRLTHVELINAYAGLGFFAKDLFVIVRANRPGVSRMLKQRHARKNHSYFLVFTKVTERAKGCVDHGHSGGLTAGFRRSSSDSMARCDEHTADPMEPRASRPRVRLRDRARAPDDPALPEERDEMSDTKHTDEGWKYDEIAASHGCPRVVDKDGFPIAELRGWGHLIGTGALNLPPEEAARIQDARGRRIAAVNELLETLKGVAKWCHSGHGFFPAKQCGMCAPVLAAIAKAERR